MKLLRSRFAAAVIATVAVLGDVTYRIVKEDIGELQGARYPHNAETLGCFAIVLLGCIGYFVVRVRQRRRGDTSWSPGGVVAFLTFAATFVFVNTVPREAELIPGGVFFVLQTLVWDLGGILALAVARSERGELVDGLRGYAVALVLLQSAVGIIGANRAGDQAMTILAGVLGFVSILAMLALAIRRDLFEPAPAASSAPLRPG